MTEKHNFDTLCDAIRDKFLAAPTDSDFFIQVQDKLVSQGKYEKREIATFRANVDALLALKSSPAELYWFAKAMEEIAPSTIRVADYFSEGDIYSFKNYTREKIKIEELYIFHGAYQLAENQWTTRASIRDIALQSKYNIIRTDPNLQRQSRKSSVLSETNEIMRKIFVNSKRVDAIEECLVTDKYAFNTIRLNVMDDGEYSPLYDAESHTLVIPKGADCIVLDGNHRRKACEQAYTHHPELRYHFSEQYFQIALTFFTAARAKEVVYQEWNTEKVSANHIKSMKTNMSNEVVDEIIRSNQSERIYADKITTTGTEKRSGNSLMIYADLADAINKYYKTNSLVLRKDAKEIADWLIRFYNYISTIFVKDFSDTKTSLKSRWITNNYVMSYGMVYLSFVLKDKEDWEELVLKILGGINWSNTASPIDPSKSIANIKNVEMYFEEIVKNGNL